MATKAQYPYHGGQPKGSGLPGGKIQNTKSPSDSNATARKTSPNPTAQKTPMVRMKK